MSENSTPVSENSTPVMPLALGAAGLVPFLVLSGAMLFEINLPLIGNAEAARFALLVYAIAILSFLGGVRWGIALGFEDQAKAARDYVLAVLPALVGWAAIGLNEPSDMWMLCIAFIALGLLDFGLTCRTVAPEWYGKFRLVLSAVAALALGVAAFLS